MGLRQSGRPITSIPTLKGMLEVVLDVLEGNFDLVLKCFSTNTFAVLRYLRSDRKVLHRDISKGNVLCRRADNTTSGRRRWFATH
jgi:Ser/Thr protein kinase RdoA (MazF antagonist)